MSFTVVDAPDREAIHRNLAAELFGVFGLDAVHVCEVDQDRTSAEGKPYVLRPDGTVEGAGAARADEQLRHTR